MPNKSFVWVICLIILIALSAWAYLYRITDEYTRSYDQNKIEVAQLRKNKKADSLKIIEYRRDRDLFSDSLMGVLVEKGQAEIELNRKTEELNQAKKRYKQLRELKDTASAINTCDSIVYTYIPAYQLIDSTVNDYNDSAINLATGQLKKRDDIIELDYDKANKAYEAHIKYKMSDLADKKTKNRQQKKAILKAGLLGVVVGLIIGLLR